MSERLVTVDIADLKVSSELNVALITHALGSCIAVILWDPTRKVAGMIHYMLPNSAVSPEKARSRPAMFADTGVPLLFESMYAHGCHKRDLIVKVVGACATGTRPQGHDDHDAFEIGQRNYAALRTMFSKVGVAIAAEDVGGRHSRTVRISVASGVVRVRAGLVETLL